MSLKGKKILVPTDFSEVCTNATNHAATFSSIINAEIVLLFVINRDTRNWLKKIKLPLASISEKLNNEKLRIEKKYSISVSIIEKEGSVFSVIPNVAEQIEADLMFLGSYGKTGIHSLFGNRAIRIIDKSNIPVFVVQKRLFGTGYHKILLPLTADVEYNRKKEWALEIAKSFNSEVHLFVAEEFTSKEQNRLESIADELSISFENQGVPLVISVANRKTNYVDQLMEYATTINADLFVIMADNDQFEPDFILPSLDVKMVTNSHQIPVLCINPKDV